MTVVTFTNAGDDVWECPAGVTVAKVEVRAASGGAGAGNSGTGGGGAGGGAYSREDTYAVTAGRTYNLHVAAAGPGHYSLGDDGDPGEDSWFDSPSILSAQGGRGGFQARNGGAGGLGGSTAAGVGSVRFSGGSGAAGSTVSEIGGGRGIVGWQQ